MESRLITTGLIIVLIVGLILTFINPIQSFLIKRTSEQGLDVSAEEIIQNENKDAVFDFTAVQSLTVSDVLKAQSEAKNAAVVGSIAIPSIDLQLPISKGVDETALLIGAGTMNPDQQLGQGNYALASHYIENKHDILFGPLYNAQIGDMIYVTDKQQVYVYEISKIDVIKATDVHVIDDVANETLLTLITCAEKGVKRLAVTATFVEQKSFDELKAIF